jgi:REP element-mobilizing transposase RayT
MARKVRVVVAGGWYHGVNRGNRREALFRTNTDRRRFLGRLAELRDRFRTEIHAFGLRDNHYQLVLRTPDANLREVNRWLQVGTAGGVSGDRGGGGEDRRATIHWP